jgi:hypothetical protein
MAFQRLTPTDIGFDDCAGINALARLYERLFRTRGSRIKYRHLVLRGVEAGLEIEVHG